MGFFAKAAKVGANAEIWAGTENVVEGFRDMENPNPNPKPTPTPNPNPSPSPT